MKYLLLIFAITLSGMAMDFKTFEKRAIELSPALESARLDTEAAAVQGRMALRYENPSAEGEISRFDINDAANDSGWRIGLSQPIRVFGLQDDLKGYADAMVAAAEKSYESRRSRFLMALRSRYTQYVKAVRMQLLIKEEIELSKKLESIAKIRFESGAGTRARVMQASLQRVAAETRLIEQKQKIAKSYYALLKAASIDEHVSLDAAFIYPVKSDMKKALPNNPQIQALEAEKRVYEEQAKTDDRSVKVYRLFAEYENEPDQSIGRIGIGMDLPIFNRNKEEYRLAGIRARQTALKTVLLKKSQKSELESLQIQLGILAKRFDALLHRLDKEKELLALFEEGYRMAQSSLLDLIQTKNSLIETKRKIINTEYLANLYRIRIDYLKGALK